MSNRPLTDLKVGDTVDVFRNLTHPAWGDVEVDEFIGEAEVIATGRVFSRPGETRVRVSNSFWYLASTGDQEASEATRIELPAQVELAGPAESSYELAVDTFDRLAASVGPDRAAVETLEMLEDHGTAALVREYRRLADSGAFSHRDAFLSTILDVLEPSATD